eukprot:jgi/Astpho2/7224/Aster-x1424
MVRGVGPPTSEGTGGKRDACKGEACAIQTCLANEGYNMSKCQKQVDVLKKCCKDHQFESTHCGFVAPGEDSGESDKPGDTVFRSGKGTPAGGRS